MSFCIGRLWHSWGKWSDPQPGIATIFDHVTRQETKEPCEIQVRRCTECNLQQIRRAM